MVATKPFLVSLILMPILMFGSIFAIQFLGKLDKSEEQKIAVWDPEGKIFGLLKQAADARNSIVKASLESSEVGSDQLAHEKLEKGLKKPGSGPIPDKDLFLIQRLENEILTDEDRVELSNKVRNKELHAFLEVPSGVADLSNLAPQDGSGGESVLKEIKFYSSGGGIQPSRRWVSSVVSEFVKQERMSELGVDLQKVQLASVPVTVKSLGLVEKSSDGKVTTKQSKGALEAIFVPMGMMMFMMMVIFLAGMPMLESVLEEKSQRIAEVLLGSCNPTQLMAGKLLGTVAGSMTIFLFYTLVGYTVAARGDYLSMIPFEIMPWFCIFQFLGVLFYCSIYMAIGSAVSQMKEAQSFLLPVSLVLAIPMVTWFLMINKPDGPLAFWLSVIPPTAPMVMMLRMATGVTVPLWQILMSLSLLILGTIGIVYIAGRIFRVGILWQGKAPKLVDLFGWALGKAA